MLAVPAFGQVQGELAAAVPGGTGGHGDQVAADGRGPGLRERQAGQGAAGDVGEQLLDDRVVAVLPLGLGQLEGQSVNMVW